MASSLRALAGILFLFSFLAQAPALIVGQADGSAATPAEQADASRINDAFGHDVIEFPYWQNIGTVGLGTGTYIGDGWVVTAAHVGCFPFVSSDGTIWKPIYDSYMVLHVDHDTHGDVAIFRLEGRPNLPAIPSAGQAVTANAPAIVVGNGYTQDPKAEPLVLDGRTIGTLGFYTRPVRAKLWGRLYTNGNGQTETITSAKGARTRVFSSRFDRKAHAAQATDGDSGSPAFVYNTTEARWELAGCIAAVSHKNRYVPYGSKSFIAPLPCNYANSKIAPLASFDFGAFKRPAS